MVTVGFCASAAVATSMAARAVTGSTAATVGAGLLGAGAAEGLGVGVAGAAAVGVEDGDGDGAGVGVGVGVDGASEGAAAGTPPTRSTIFCPFAAGVTLGTGSTGSLIAKSFILGRVRKAPTAIAPTTPTTSASATQGHGLLRPSPARPGAPGRSGSASAWDVAASSGEPIRGALSGPSAS